MRRLYAAIAIAACLGVALSVLGGCAPAGRALDGTAWRLKSWSVNSVGPTDFRITARFDNGQVSGVSAVNTYGGGYTAGPDNAFLVGQLSSTLMAGPDAANRAETAYMELLAEARSFKVEGDTLTLSDENGNVSLVFERSR